MTDDQQKPWQAPQDEPASNGADAAGETNAAAQTDQGEQPTETIPTPSSAVSEDQPTTQLPSTAASAAPAAAPAQSAAPVTPTYSAAPQYGAYAQQGAGSTPQPAGQSGQPTSGQPTSGQPEYGQPMPQGPFNPYPFGAPEPSQNANNGQNGSNGQHGFVGFNPFGAQNSNAQNAANENGRQPGQPGQVPPQNPQGPFLPGMAGQPMPQGKGGKSSTTTILTAVIAALVSAALMLGLGWGLISSGVISVPSSSNLNSIGSTTGGSGSATATTGEAVDWKTVASNVSSSVVSITTTLSNGTGKGSGAIISTDGHIVTNNHVVEGAQKITVTLSNGNLYSAQLVGTDVTTDLAVIKLDNPPSDLKAVEFADSDQLAVGENVMAIGNPLGYENTATTGIVSALNRPVTVTDEETNADIVTNAVQIDAAINPGNSGGPTFNAAGQVIGINSSIASTATSSSSAGSIGIGFAIPSNLVKRVANEIVQNGKVQHAALGIKVKTGTATADGVTRAGAAVDSVSNASGPAAKAGIKAGDVIVGYNGNTVSDVYSLLGYVRASALGDTAKLTLVRDGKTLEVNVTLDQEEAAVNGSSSSNGSSNGSNGSGSGNGSGNGSNGYGYGYGNSGNGSGNGSGNSQNNNGDNGGLTDPFSQLFGFGNN